MAGMDIGLDLGTSQIVMATPQKGVVLHEPMMMAVETATDRPIAFGKEAAEMIGRTPDSITVIQPLSRGVIADYDHAEQLLRYFLHKACRYKIVKPRVTVTIPSRMTEVEKRSVLEAVHMAGARRVSLVEKAVAAAIGDGADVTAAQGCMCIHLGAGSTEVACVALGGVVTSVSQRTGSYQLDEAIVRYAREKFSLIIGDRMAEEAKIEAGGVLPRAMSFRLRGRDVLTGLPRAQEITSAQLREAIAEPLSEILGAICEAMEVTPPEILADVLATEVRVAGGGARLFGFTEWVSKQTRTPCRLVDEPEQVTAVGAAKSVKVLSRLSYDTYDISQFSYHMSDNVV